MVSDIREWQLEISHSGNVDTPEVQLSCASGFPSPSSLGWLPTTHLGAGDERGAGISRDLGLVRSKKVEVKVQVLVTQSCLTL